MVGAATSAVVLQPTGSTMQERYPSSALAHKDGPSMLRTHFPLVVPGPPTTGSASRSAARSARASAQHAPPAIGVPSSARVQHHRPDRGHPHLPERRRSAVELRRTHSRGVRGAAWTMWSCCRPRLQGQGVTASERKRKEWPTRSLRREVLREPHDLS